ncbi:MAG: hypothetical protein ACRD97_00085 [Nitrososphaeraceae archaeon]
MKQLELQKETAAQPYILFEYTIRSPYTKESYFRRLRRFFNAISLERPTFECRCNLFVENGPQDPNWAFNSILKFVLEEKKRVEKKEITGGTLRNSVKTIKTFCEVTDVLIPWKKITSENLQPWTRIDSVCVLSKGIICNGYKDGSIDALPSKDSTLLSINTTRALLLFYVLISSHLLQAELPPLRLNPYVENNNWW